MVGGCRDDFGSGDGVDASKDDDLEAGASLFTSEDDEVDCRRYALNVLARILPT